MVENTSMTLIRIESSKFRKAKGPLALFALWCTSLIICFSAGAGGPPVLANAGKHNLVNYTNIGQNATSLENGTLVTFSMHPDMYQQFAVVSLRVLNPQRYPGHAFSPALGALPSEDWDRQGMHYLQRWSIVAKESKGPKEAVRSEIFEKLRQQGWPMMSHHESTARCHHDQEWCKPIVVYTADHIREAGYYFDIFIHNAPENIIKPEYYDQNIVPFDISVTTMNPAYTSFEMGFKYFFMVVTLLILVAPQRGYLAGMMNTHYSKIGSHHVWVLVMLLGLVWFNEPFMAVRVNSYVATDGLEKFSMLTSTLYVAYLLYYWLVLVDDARIRGMGAAGLTSMVPFDFPALRDGTGSGVNPLGHGSVPDPFDHKSYDGITWNTCGKNLEGLGFFYLPKIILVVLIWAFTFASYAALAAERELDPSYLPYDSKLAEEEFAALAVAAVVFMSIYIAWMATLLIWTFVVFNDLPASFKWLFGCTVFTMTLVVIGVFAGIAYPVPSSSFNFIGFYGMINVYVWIVAIAWTPVQANSTTKNAELSSMSGKGAAGDLEDVDLEPDFRPGANSEMI